MTSLSDSATSKNWCNTQIKVEKFDFMWTIENFSYCREEIGQSFKSSSIKFEKNGKLEWCLKIYPKGEREESKDFLSLYLNLNESDRSDVMAKYVFYVLNEKKEKTNALEATGIRKFVKGKGWGFEKFVKRSLLFDKSNKLLSSDKLTIFCEISIVCDTVNNIAYSKTTSEKKPLPKITKDIGNMLKSPKLSDCIIKVGDATIKVHKFMLASRSEVFYAMFNNKCRESQLHEIEMTDFPLEIIKEMIYYIYTDNSPNLELMTKEILAIAEKYNLEGLKAMAEDALSINLDIKNVCEHLEISEIYSAESLKEKCIDFICMNTPNIVNTKDWNKLVVKFPWLLNEIIKNLAGVSKVSTVSNTAINEESQTF